MTYDPGLNLTRSTITPDRLVEGKGPISGGLVRMLSVDCAGNTGAPILTLFFVDKAIQPAEFSLEVKQAGRLLATMLAAQKKVRWDWRKPADHAPQAEEEALPVEGQITDCGDGKIGTVKVDPSNGYMRLEVQFRQGAVGKLDFILDPAVCLSLMGALYDLHQTFGWSRSLGSKPTLN